MSNQTHIDCNNDFSLAAFDQAEDALVELLGGGRLYKVSPPPAKNPHSKPKPYRQTLELMDYKAHVDLLWYAPDSFVYPLAWRAEKKLHQNVGLRYTKLPDRLNERQYIRLAPPGALVPKYFVVSCLDVGGELSLLSLVVVETEHINLLIKEKEHDWIEYEQRGKKEEMVTIPWQSFVNYDLPIKIFPPELAILLQINKASEEENN
jgi:hypothetical protein